MQFLYPYICCLIMNTVASHSLAKVVVGIKDSIGQMTYLYLLYTLVRANNRFCWIWKLKGVTKNNWGGQCTNKEHPSRPQAQIAHGRVLLHPLFSFSLLSQLLTLQSGHEFLWTTCVWSPLANFQVNFLYLGNSQKLLNNILYKKGGDKLSFF